MDEPTVEAVREVGATGASAVFVVGPEHDVVREQLRAAVEELRECLLASIGVERVLLLDPHPGELHSLLLDLLVPLSLLGLELRQLVPGRLPFLAGSDRVLRHRFLLLVDLGRSRESDILRRSDATVQGVGPRLRGKLIGAGHQRRFATWYGVGSMSIFAP